MVASAVQFVVLTMPFAVVAMLDLCWIRMVNLLILLVIHRE